MFLIKLSSYFPHLKIFMNVVPVCFACRAVHAIHPRLVIFFQLMTVRAQIVETARQLLKNNIRE